MLPMIDFVRTEISVGNCSSQSDIAIVWRSYKNHDALVQKRFHQAGGSGSILLHKISPSGN